MADPNNTPEEIKSIFKEALKEWLDEKFAAFGKYTLTGIGAAALGVLAYFIIATSGWTKP
jgi:hypothetical protein